MREKRIWIIMIIVLVALNVVTLAFLWSHEYRDKGVRPMGKHRNGSPEGYMVRHLNLDENQAREFKKARKRHFEKIRPIEQTLQQARHELFKKNTEGLPSDSIQQELTLIASCHKQLDSLTYIHFMELRSYCTPEQSQKLDRVVQDMTSRSFRPQRGPGPPLME